jgi:hypothetical protein
MPWVLGHIEQWWNVLRTMRSWGDRGNDERTPYHPSTTSEASNYPITFVHPITLSVVDTGVDRGVEHVDQHIDQHKSNRDHQHRSLNCRIIAGPDRLHDVAP